LNLTDWANSGSYGWNWWWSNTYSIYIDPAQSGGMYGYGPESKCRRFGPWTVEALIAHELGHAYQAVKRGGDWKGTQRQAIASENLWNEAYNRTHPDGAPRPLRTSGCQSADTWSH
jgi:hypothetical protein